MSVYCMGTKGWSLSDTARSMTVACAAVRVGHWMDTVRLMATSVPSIFPDADRPVLLDQIFSFLTVIPSRLGGGITTPLIFSL